jgi:hypothetical protein
MTLLGTYVLSVATALDAAADPTRHGTEKDRQAYEHGEKPHDYDQGLAP